MTLLTPATAYAKEITNKVPRGFEDFSYVYNEGTIQNIITFIKSSIVNTDQFLQANLGVD